MFTRLVAVTLALALAAPTIAIAQAPNCANAADQFDRDTRAFIADAERQNLQFVKDLALEKITAELKEQFKKPFEGTIANDIVEHLNESWEMANSARAHLGRARDYFNEWLKCFTAARGSCNLEALNKQYQDAFKAYVDSLLDHAGMAEAQSRVERARSLLHNYLERTMNISTGTMNAMAQCMAPMSRQVGVQVTESPAPAATPSEGVPEVAEPPSKPVDGGGGMGAGNTLALIGAIGGGAYAASMFMPKSCPEPTVNFLTVCANQGGGSQACVNARAEQQSYCTCMGMTFRASAGGCVP